MVSVWELVSRGRSGGIAPGMEMADARAVLGAETDHSRGRPPILKYGPLELSFHDGEAALIAYYAGRSPMAGRVAMDLPRSATEVERVLTDHGLAFRRKRELTYDDQEAIEVVATGAIVLFESGQLTSVQLPRPSGD